MMKFSKLLLCSFVTVVAATPAQAQDDGTNVLKQMHDAYHGKWYKTLTFIQKTTHTLQDGTTRVDTWYESQKHFDDRGTLLRIDVGDVAGGNGFMTSGDSSWIVRAGKLAGTRATGNEFVPLVAGVYMQPVEKTAQQLTAMGFYLSKTTTGTWQGKPVWIVGTTSAADSATKQFWIEKDRKILVRAVLGQKTPIQVVLDKYERAGGGWIPTWINVTAGGKPMQLEEYTDWKIDVALPNELFDATQWTAAPHWAAKKAGS